ncbi:MAG: hypothetical protein FWC27_01480 [Firmicutes bacterium]|nr:hypothetical protein [Bacillota bacterium]
MKKFIACLLVGLFALAFAACDNDNPPATTTENKPTQSTPGTAQDIYFAPKGVRLEIGMLPEGPLEALGEPKSTLECPSCAIPNAMDTDYNYPGFKLTVTQPEDGSPYIAAIQLIDDTYTIPGGVTIGSTLEEITAAYGTDYREDNGHYYYTQGLSVLHFATENGKVSQILYEYDLDH